MAFFETESPLGLQGNTIVWMYHETLKTVDSWIMSLAILFRK